ncbi:MAG TPA: MraY family glycosyltransferase [Patescibacteria group bacterium]|nr:MraY family glycosyltransferase [Patescibacteria group bacterium]
MGDIRYIFLLPWIVAAISAFLVTPLVIKFANKLGIVDDPKINKHPKVIHTYPVPRAGGLAIFIAIAIASYLYLPFDKHILGIFLGAIVLVAMGLIDDKYNLNPYLRLLLGLLAASIPVAFGIGISFITNPFGGIIDLAHPQINFFLFGSPHSIWLVSDIFAIFWITFLMNMINMGAKGVDGQLSGVVVISALTIAFVSLKYSSDAAQWPVIILAAITAGSYFGFLPWHIFPQKIMPGYGGSTLAGYLLGVLSILATAKVGILLVVLGIPLIDTGYVVIKRMLKGKSPVWGDRDHLHHKLLDAGFTKGQVAIFYWGITAILAIFAINLNTGAKVYTMIGIAVFLAGLFLFLTKRNTNQKQDL